MFMRVASAVAAVVALALPASSPADVVEGPRSTWVPDGEVRAVEVSGSTAYIGGNFSRIAPYTGSSARFDASTGSLRAWPEVDGVVNAVVADGNGGWYLGGDFRSVGGTPRSDLAHVLADGTLDPNWAPTTNGLVRAIAVDGTTGPVYAGGEFSSANGTARTNLAGFARADGALTSFSGSVSDVNTFNDFKGVHALLLRSTTLYVGGIFNTADDPVGPTLTQPRNRGAAFDVTNSNTTGWNPDANHTITGLALAPGGTHPFVAGRFSTIGGQSRNRIAQLDATTGAALGSWVPPVVSGDVFAVAVSATHVYIGGSGIRFNPMEPPRSIAAMSITGAVASPTFDPPETGFVRSLAISGPTVYAGSSSSAGNKLAAYDATNGDATAFTPNVGRGLFRHPSGGIGGVFGIGVNGSDVVAGGTFINAGGVARRNLAAIDLNTGQPTAFLPPMEGMFANLVSVRALALADGLVWAGGDFITEGPNERAALAAFDPTTGAIASFKQDPSGAVFTPVSDLEASGSTVYVGGGFTSLGGMPRRNIGAVQHVPGTAGTVLPFDPDVNGNVRAIKRSGDTVYIGGQFTEVNGAIASLKVDRRNLAAVDATTALARPWDPDADAPVNALALDGDTVFAGGEFGVVNRGAARQRLAAFEAQGAGAARPWAPGADAVVRSLAVHGPTVFAGGDFANAGGAPRLGVAALDAQSGAPDPFSPVLASEDRNGLTPGDTPVHRVNGLSASADSGLVMGGSFVMNSPVPRTANLSAFGLVPLPVLPPGGAPGGETPGGAGGAGGAGAALPGDEIDPNLAVTASRRRFRVGRGATAADGQATAAGRRRTPAGTTLTLRLSEAARVRFEVFVKTRGRRVGRRCVRQTRRNRNRPRCTRLVAKKPVFTRSAPAGRSRVRWSGRLGRKALRPGAYVLRATPTDAAGNVGTRRQIAIRIVRR